MTDSPADLPSDAATAAAADERAAVLAHIGQRIQAVASAARAGKMAADFADHLSRHYRTLADDIAQGLHMPGGEG